MDDQVVQPFANQPPAQPVAPPPVQPTPVPVAPVQPAPPPFDEARFNDTLQSVLEKYPEQATRTLKDKLGVTKLELHAAFSDACLEFNVDKQTAEKYRNLLSGDTPDATRARIKEFAELRGTLQPQGQVAQPDSPQPVAQAPAPQYQAPPPLQTASANIDITKLSYDQQLEQLAKSYREEVLPTLSTPLG